MEFKIRRRQRKIEIVPMIDVIFFMLVFFMLFSTLDKAKTGIEVETPQTVNIGEARQNTAVISIDRNARIFWGRKPVSLEQLQSETRAELTKDPTTRFIIRPDSQVPYLELIRITDCLAGEGVTKPLWGVDRRRMPKISVGTEPVN
jgi:biopolymer transport protein ExbD